ncbi:hypothetical protein C8R42DRAFT_690508 [Lentinula raphanica]|nr:hypothetical protein C8R42DRAFT_690508 [Lentinula raphanica]
MRFQSLALICIYLVVLVAYAAPIPRQASFPQVIQNTSLPQSIFQTRIILLIVLPLTGWVSSHPRTSKLGKTENHKDHFALLGCRFSACVDVHGSWELCKRRQGYEGAHAAGY